MGRLGSITSLPPSRRRLAVACAGLYLVSTLSLALPVGLGRAKRVIDWLGRLPVACTSTSPPPSTIAWTATATADELPWTVRCLPRALVGGALLSAHGYDAEVKIGVDPGETGLAAHAWVECRDTVLVGAVDDLDRYAPLSADGPL